MSIADVTLIILIGFVAGILSGTLGVDGGIVLLPGLVFLLGFTQHQAQGTSLAMMVPPVVILAAYNYYKHGHVNVQTAVILIFTFIAGAYLGSLLAVNLPDKILRRIFGFFMLFVAVKMILGK
jgi:uncharacterized protein